MHKRPISQVRNESSRYVGLNFTPASHFQIFRGSLIIFTGLLRVTLSLILPFADPRLLEGRVAEKGPGMVQVAGHGIEPLMSNFSVNSFPVKVVILAGLGVVAVGSFPPFAEEICNRFPILT